MVEAYKKYIKALEEYAEELEQTETEIWVMCACEPKKPENYSGDQWECRHYHMRAAERTKICAWHKEFDELRKNCLLAKMEYESEVVDTDNEKN
jgi:hypothetical protein